MTQIVSLQRRIERPCFAWLLPLWFAVGTTLAVNWPGHGWQLFSIGALPGVWVAFLLGADGGMFAWLVPTLVGGVPILWFLGRLLDRVDGDVRLWLVATFVGAAIAGYVLLQGHSDLDGAIAFHGSFQSFFVCALQLGSYGATLLLLALGAGSGSGRKID